MKHPFMLVLCLALVGIACSKPSQCRVLVPCDTADFPYSKMSQAELVLGETSFDLKSVLPGEYTSYETLPDGLNWELSYVTNSVTVQRAGIVKDYLVRNSYPQMYYDITIEFANVEEVAGGKDRVTVYLTDWFK